MNQAVCTPHAYILVGYYVKLGIQPANYGPWAKSSLPSVFVNKVLLEKATLIVLLVFCPECFPTTEAKLMMNFKSRFGGKKKESQPKLMVHVEGSLWLTDWRGTRLRSVFQPAGNFYPSSLSCETLATWSQQQWGPPEVRGSSWLAQFAIL